jgi:hypothetical protein
MPYTTYEIGAAVTIPLAILATAVSLGSYVYSLILKCVGDIFSHFPNIKQSKESIQRSLLRLNFERTNQFQLRYLPPCIQIRLR